MFLIRVHNDATKLLRDTLASEECTLVPIKLEGPYGVTPQIDRFSTALLFAGTFEHRRTLITGGTGIARAISLLLALLDGKERLLTVRLVHLVWHTRSAHNIEWIRPLLDDVCRRLANRDGITVEVDVHVTRYSDPTPGIHTRLIAADGCRSPAISPSGPRAMPDQEDPARQYRFVRWRVGRANIGQIIAEDRERSRGPIFVTGETGVRHFLMCSLWAIFTSTRRSCGDQGPHIDHGALGRTKSNHLR